MTSFKAMNRFIWALLAALFAGLTAILAKIGMTGVSSSLTTTIRTTAVQVFTGSIALATTSPAELGSLSRRLGFFWRFRVWLQGCRGYAIL